MTTYAYAEPVNSNLICCICRVPFIEPTATKTCSHTFCKECISHAVAITPQCPVDRSSLSEDDLHLANPIVRHLVDELLVECPQRSLGCSHTCQRQWLPMHIKDECQFVKVACCEEQCEEVVLRKDVGKHSGTCERRVVQCEACGVRIQFVDLPMHHDECPAEDATCPHCTTVLPRGDISSHITSCPDLIIPCDHAAHGCPWTGPRHTLSSCHLQQCPYESIKGFFALNISRFSALETENMQLRGRLEDLEDALRSTKRDLHTAKQALGPWFRPDGCHIPPRPPPPPSEPAPRPYQRRRLSNALNSAMFGFPDGGSPIDLTTTNPTLHPSTTTTSLAPSADDLAAFFPPPDPSPSQPPLPPSEALMVMGPMADGTYPRSAPSSPIAPINLNTTLEGSLTGLRSSIVMLATSLDSESRRHDIALTTETLRVNEEVGSLRAIVHGLRMQVHQIMMDRNSQVTGREDGDGVGYNYSHARSATAVEPWTSSVRYLNHNPPVHRPISIGTTTHIQTTKL